MTSNIYYNWPSFPLISLKTKLPLRSFELIYWVEMQESKGLLLWWQAPKMQSGELKGLNNVTNNLPKMAKLHLHFSLHFHIIWNFVLVCSFVKYNFIYQIYSFSILVQIKKMHEILTPICFTCIHSVIYNEIEECTKEKVS